MVIASDTPTVTSIGNKKLNRTRTSASTTPHTVRARCRARPRRWLSTFGTTAV